MLKTQEKSRNNVLTYDFGLSGCLRIGWGVIVLAPSVLLFGEQADKIESGKSRVVVLIIEPHFAETAGDQVCPFEPAEETSTGFQFIGLVTD